jgi:hypothetical protein
MIYSLQTVRSDDEGAKEFMTVITSVIKESLEKIDGRRCQYFSYIDVSMILYGLKGMRTDSTGITIQPLAQLLSKIITFSLFLCSFYFANLLKIVIYTCVSFRRSINHFHRLFNHPVNHPMFE